QPGQANRRPTGRRKRSRGGTVDRTLVSPHAELIFGLPTPGESLRYASRSMIIPVQSATSRGDVTCVKISCDRALADRTWSKVISGVGNGGFPMWRHARDTLLNRRTIHRCELLGKLLFAVGLREGCRHLRHLAIVLCLTVTPCNRMAGAYAIDVRMSRIALKPGRHGHANG